MILYRPVGMHELRLVYESGMRAFPPRLPEQPIFYPVLNFGYAEQIARDWNTKSRSFAGYVTRFDVEDGYASRFERHVVGGREHEELWVPSEELVEFNRLIIGLVEVVAAYFGPNFVGHVPERGDLAGLDADTQLVWLVALLHDDEAWFREAISDNRAAVFLHYLFWEQRGIGDEGIAEDERDRTISAIRAVWPRVSPEVPLAAP